MTPKTREIVKRKKLRRAGEHHLQKKEWLSNYAERQRLKHRDRAVKWSLGTFTFLLISTLVLYLLQGFSPWGFKLPEPLLTSLGRATVCEAAGFTGLVFKFLFK